jgi:hypothetical protein
LPKERAPGDSALGAMAMLRGEVDLAGMLARRVHLPAVARDSDPAPKPWLRRGRQAPVPQTVKLVRPDVPFRQKARVMSERRRPAVPSLEEAVEECRAAETDRWRLK